MNDTPYKIIWIHAAEDGKHVHYEQYSNLQTAEQRVKTLQDRDQVTGVIYYPEDQLPIR